MIEFGALACILIALLIVVVFHGLTVMALGNNYPRRKH